MKVLQGDIKLLPINVERDAPFAYSWFTRVEGRDTLLRMGNAEHEIMPSTLAGERATMHKFSELEVQNKQITRAIVIDDATIGVVWIELFENHGVKAPSVHIMIGNPDYRGRGIGYEALKRMIEYARNELRFETIYTRYLAENSAVKKLNNKLGFVADGDEYTDENGLEWQNAKMN